MTHPVRLILSYQGVFDVDKWAFCGVCYVGNRVFAIILGLFERFSGSGRFGGAERPVLAGECSFTQVWKYFH